ncbi:MAG: hypothetical protein ACXW1T_12080, partial [Methylophilus sp.]
MWACDGAWITTSQTNDGGQVNKEQAPACPDGSVTPQPEVIESINDQVPSVDDTNNVSASEATSNTEELQETIAERNQSTVNQEQVKYEEPIYSKTDEVGYSWLSWIKWLVFFVILSVTLTPLMLIYFSNGQLVGIYFAAAAITGAANATGGVIKGAANGVSWGITVFLMLLFLGPFGTLYCIYHPLLALFSDSDKTYCCTMTWLGETTISKKAISSDGHWLAEIEQQMPQYFGLGDKEFAQNNTLSVMNLTNGQHVKWPQSKQKLLGVNPDKSEIEEIAINEGVQIRPTNYLNGDKLWYDVKLGDNFLKPLNAERTSKVKIRYQLLGSEEQQAEQLQLADVLTGQVVLIQSDKAYNRHYLSYDGRVLALVRAKGKDKSTDGLISQLTRIAGNYFFESWKIEFWNVATGKKIA